MSICVFVSGKFSVDSCQTSTMKWPLLPTTCKFEVLLSNINEVHPLCRSLSFVSDYPINNPNAKVAVNVSSGSFFDVDVAGYTMDINSDYGISIYIYPQNESGPIFNYRSTDGSFEMAVWLENANLKAMRRISSNPQAYLVNENIQPVVPNTWQKVGVSVDTSGKKLKTFVATNLQENSDTTNTKDATGGDEDVKRPLVTPGVIRVGAMFNESVHRTFSGLVTCIGLVIGNKDLDCLSDCVQKSSWTFSKWIFIILKIMTQVCVKCLFAKLCMFPSLRLSTFCTKP